jgi:hypothetical protein
VQIHHEQISCESREEHYIVKAKVWAILMVLPPIQVGASHQPANPAQAGEIPDEVGIYAILQSQVKEVPAETVEVYRGMDKRSKGKAATAALRPAFDTERNDVPPHFLGHNADAVYEAAKKNLPSSAQSKFESRSEYNAHVFELSNKPFWGDMKASDQFAFVLGQAWSGASSEGWLNGDLETYYDAEAKKMSIGIPLELGSPDSNQWAALWHRVRIPLGSYVGENAFGARRVVHRARVIDTDIFIEGSEWLDFYCDRKYETDHKSCSFEVDAQQARNLSRTARVIVIGTLIPPFVSNDNGLEKPSTDIPVEFRRSYRYLHLRLEQLWIVNSATGQVIKKYSRAQQASEYPLNVEFRLRKEGEFTYPDARCNQFAYLFPSSLVSVDYSVDGNGYTDEIVKDLKVSARHFVDVKIVYCDVSRVEVLLNGQPYDLQCEKQDDFIGNQSQCKRIQLVP